MNNVLKKVNLYDFLNSEEGLDTILLEKGSNLSGGQYQRLVLARAILRDTNIYIFDEATSNIDMESENQIMNVISEISKEKTIILISHRLENVVQSDRIYVLEKGEIVEEGAHQELLDSKGTYEKLYKTQQDLESFSTEGSMTYA